MLETKDFANIIQSGLNSLTEAFSFLVYAGEGEYTEAVKSGRFNPTQQMCGALRPVQSSISPILNLKNYYFQYVLEFVIPTTYQAEVMAVIGKFVEATIGSIGTLNNYGYLLTMTLPEVSQKAQRSDVGDSVLISMAVYFQVISNGKISNECVTTIDGEEIMYSAASFGRRKIVETDNYANDIEMSSVASGQGLVFKCLIPYRETSVIESLVSEILTATALTTTHDITYSDGGVSMSETEMILSDGELNLNAGAISSVSLSFVRAKV